MSPRKASLLASVILATTCQLALAGAGDRQSPPALLAAAAIQGRGNFDENWRFIKGDPEGTGSTLAYATLKPVLLASSASPDFVVRPTDANPGANVAYAQPGFDDKAWHSLNLPHDWAIESPFDQALSGGTGKLPYFGVGWYRKTFHADADTAGQRVFLDVDGAMAYASVWLNGTYLGGWPYGYSSFRVELTSALKPGADNVVAIRLDNPNNSSRWYPGGGLYRNVWLVTENPVHLAHWGTYVTTPEVSGAAATVSLKVDVDNQSATPANAEVSAQIFAVGADGRPSDQVVASIAPRPLAVGANATGTAALQVTVSNPSLWSLGHPNRYAAVVTVAAGGRTVDTSTTNFGIRTIKFDPNLGFLLNGEHVRINGVCDHSDLGPLGTVVNVRGLERQIELLKEMGGNALRTSHNPPSPELLDVCDRLGFLVMDESFDCWEKGKTNNDYHLLFADWHERDLRAEVRRDRNHPSIILWSIGNEISEQGSARGNEIAMELTKIVHSEDPTRMTVSANTSAGGFTGLPNDEYVYGFNYEPGTPLKYANYRQRRPGDAGAAILGSETSSTVSSRGFYLYPVSNNKGQGDDNTVYQVSSYDLYAPGWATTPDAEFRDQDRTPGVAGEFVWTGFDYLGEPTRSGNSRGNPPSRSSYFGILDLDGFKKDRFYLYQARWRPELPMAHLVPQNWNWKGFENEVTPVHIYTSGDEAELFLNGVSLGRKKKGDFEYRIRFDDVKYQPGELKVVAYKNGAKWAEDTVKTTGAAAALALAPDRATIAADGQDISYVTVAVKDPAGLTVPDAINALHFEISGPGKILAIDNGDATSHALIQGTKDGKAFYGLAMVIVRAKKGEPGEITLQAQSAGLAPASVFIKSR